MNDGNNSFKELIKQCCSKDDIKKVKCLLCDSENAENGNLEGYENHDILCHTYHCPTCGYYQIEEELKLKIDINEFYDEESDNIKPSRFDTVKPKLQKIIEKLNKQTPPVRPLIGRITDPEKNIITIRSLLKQY
jgi:hypothetical protein